MDFSVRSVSLCHIDSADQTFRITTTTDHSALVPSIKHMGLLHPPRLVFKGRQYTIVSGFRRIAACRSIAIPAIPAHIEDDQLPMLHFARIAVADNAFQRQLNIVEQSRAVALLRRFIQDPADWQANASALGLPVNPSAIDRLMSVADMPDSLQLAIVEGSIALPVAISINSLEPEDARTLCALFQRLNTGLNNQREILELIVELSRIEDMPVSGLLARRDIASIFTDRERQMPQQVQHLRRILKKMRFPTLSTTEDAFYQTLRKLNVNPGISLQPPRFFEGKTFRLALSFNSRRQLQSLLPDIEKIADHSNFLPE